MIANGLDKKTGASIMLCPIEAITDMIKGKWKLSILYHLFEGTKRFNELKRLVPQASRHMLTQHLRELEADELVHREVFPEVPPKVEYSLTEKGVALMPIFDAMIEWGQSYLADSSSPSVQS